MIPKLPVRQTGHHKGDFGRGILVGGCRGMAGAISLAGMACMKSGVGSLKIATTKESFPIVASFDPCYMTSVLPSDQNGIVSLDALAPLERLLKSSTAIGIGPGLGQSEGLIELVSWLYTQVPQPIVFDADALNCLSEVPEVLMHPAGPRVLTPHLGEMRRLLQDEQSDPVELADRAALLSSEAGAVIVLKGHRSQISAGSRKIFNPRGNAGMATAGSGDVLTGIITALLCQGLKAFEAAQLGCLIHGLAGDAAARRIGEISLTAKDIVRFLPKAFRAVLRKERRRQIRQQKQAKKS